MDPDELQKARPYEENQLVAGRYRVGQVLGLGGMGVVFEVEDSKAPGTRFALKALRADLQGEMVGLARKQFECEVAALDQVHSQFVVQKIDASLEGETPFIVLEKLAGHDLATYLKELGCIPKEQTILLMRMLAAGLRATHGAGWAHRDLKPENIFIVDREDGLKDLKLLDFSIAKELNDRRTTIAKGTPSYMPPEQYAGHVDERVDVYALGRVAEDMLLGFGSEAESIETSRTRLDLGKGFERWLAKAKHPDKDQRFRSPDKAVEELAKTLGVTVPPLGFPPAVYPSSRPVPKASRSAARLRAGLVALGLGAAGGVAGYYYPEPIAEAPQPAAEPAQASGSAEPPPAAAPPSPAASPQVLGATVTEPSVAETRSAPIAAPLVAPKSSAPQSSVAKAKRTPKVDPASLDTVGVGRSPQSHKEAGLGIPSDEPPSYKY